MAGKREKREFANREGLSSMGYEPSDDGKTYEGVTFILQPLTPWHEMEPVVEKDETKSGTTVERMLLVRKEPDRFGRKDVDWRIQILCSDKMIERNGEGAKAPVNPDLYNAKLQKTPDSQVFEQRHSVRLGKAVVDAALRSMSRSIDENGNINSACFTKGRGKGAGNTYLTIACYGDFDVQPSGQYAEANSVFMAHGSEHLALKPSSIMSYSEGWDEQFTAEDLASHDANVAEARKDRAIEKSKATNQSIQALGNAFAKMAQAPGDAYVNPGSSPSSQPFETGTDFTGAYGDGDFDGDTIAMDTPYNGYQ